MVNTEKQIELYPGHWLYNASILGFLLSLKMVEGKDIDEYLLKDGRILLPKKIFTELEVSKRYFEDAKISSIVAKAPIYRNYLQSSEKEAFTLFVNSLENVEKSGQCNLSNEAYNLPIEIEKQLRKKGLEKFLDRIIDFNMVFHADLGPSLDMFPNAYWNNRQSNKICQLFAFLIIHQHIPFITMSDKSKIFINAPSFSLMYKLNTLLEKLIDKENASYKNLLAMSVIDFSIKTNVMMNTWAGMNIEIVAIQKSGVIEFISLPYETIRILSNKRIAEHLSSIGEFMVLNMVIDGRLKDLIELGYRILKIAMKPTIGKEDRNFIENNFFRYENRENRNLKELANKILKLYALTEERINSKQNEYIN
jgi:CRISPR-associated protein Cst1